MKLQNNTYYWVKLITYYTTINKLETDEEEIVGRHNEHDKWNVVGSEEGFDTYNKDKEMDHLETCVIPISEAIQ